MARLRLGWDKQTKNMRVVIEFVYGTKSRVCSALLRQIQESLKCRRIHEWARSLLCCLIDHYVRGALQTVFSPSLLVQRHVELSPPCAS